MESKQGFDSWALVELMGHQRIAGRVTEEQIGGSNFVRVDVPESESAQPLTKFLGPSSIYAITPVSEETARKLAHGINAAPISVWDARRMLTAPAVAEKKQLEAESAEEDDDDEDSEGNDF